MDLQKVREVLELLEKIKQLSQDSFIRSILFEQSDETVDEKIEISPIEGEGASG